MKNISVCLAILLVCAMLTGCCLSHQWQEPTCTAPKTCSKCSETEGEALGHSWADATCTAPRICTVCGAAEGEALAHSWQEASCTAPKTCTVCSTTEGEALAHSWQEATLHAPKTCTACGAAEGTATNYFAVNGIEVHDQLPQSVDATSISFNPWDEEKQVILPANYRNFHTEVTRENPDGSKVLRLTFQLEYDYHYDGPLGECHNVVDYNVFDLYSGQLVPIGGSVSCKVEDRSYTLKMIGDSDWTGENEHTLEDGSSCVTLAADLIFELTVPADYDGLVLAIASLKHYGLEDTKWQNLLAKGMMATDFAVYADYYEDVQFFRLPIA